MHDKYVTQDLWEVLRNGLLHNNSTKHNRGTNPVRYALIKNDKELHLTPVSDKPSYFYFNVQSFIDHIDQAANLFLDELETENSDAQKKFETIDCYARSLHGFSASLFQSEWKTPSRYGFGSGTTSRVISSIFKHCPSYNRNR